MTKGKGKKAKGHPGAGTTHRNGYLLTGSSGITSADRERVSFRLRCCGTKYCVKNLDQAKRAALTDALHERSNMTWYDLKHTSKKGLGTEGIPVSSIKGRSPDFITPDNRERKVLVLRFLDGKGRIVGQRTGSVFEIVWVDPWMTLYDHGKH